MEGAAKRNQTNSISSSPKREEEMNFLLISWNGIKRILKQ